MSRYDGRREELRYYQIGGFRADVSSRTLEAWISTQTNWQSFSLVLGIHRTEGTNHLLLPDIHYPREWHPLSSLATRLRPSFYASDFGSLSPITFSTKDIFLNKLKALEPDSRKKSQRGRDNSIENRAASLPGASHNYGSRMMFEHSRTLMRLLRGLVDPSHLDIPQGCGRPSSILTLSIGSSFKEVHTICWTRVSPEALKTQEPWTIKPEVLGNVFFAEAKMYKNIIHDPDATVMLKDEGLASFKSSIRNIISSASQAQPIVLLVHDWNHEKLVFSQPGVDISTQDFNLGISMLLRPHIRTRKDLFSYDIKPAHIRKRELVPDYGDRGYSGKAGSLDGNKRKGRSPSPSRESSVYVVQTRYLYGELAQVGQPPSEVAIPCQTLGLQESNEPATAKANALAVWNLWVHLSDGPALREAQVLHREFGANRAGVEEDDDEEGEQREREQERDVKPDVPEPPRNLAPASDNSEGRPLVSAEASTNATGVTNAPLPLAPWDKSDEDDNWDD